LRLTLSLLGGKLIQQPLEYPSIDTQPIKARGLSPPLSCNLIRMDNVVLLQIMLIDLVLLIAAANRVIEHPVSAVEKQLFSAKL